MTTALAPRAPADANAGPGVVDDICLASRHKRASGACTFLANDLVEAVVRAASRCRSRSGKAPHRSAESRATPIAQIRACAAWARRDCSCPRAGAGRAIAMATLRSPGIRLRTWPAGPSCRSGRGDSAYAAGHSCALPCRPCIRRSPFLALRVGPSSRAGSRGTPTPESGFGTQVLVEWRRRCWSRSAATVSPRAIVTSASTSLAFPGSPAPGSRLPASAGGSDTLAWSGKETSPGSDQRRYRLSSMGGVLVASADCSFPQGRGLANRALASKHGRRPWL